MSTDADGNAVHKINRLLTVLVAGSAKSLHGGDALDVMGKDVTVPELMEIIMQDYDFYMSSGGGVTLAAVS